MTTHEMSAIGAQPFLRGLPERQLAGLAGLGRGVSERLGRGDVVGLSWMLPPYQWRFGAVTTQPMQAFEFDARAVRAACDADPVLGFELSQRFSAVLLRRLQGTRPP